jgi:AcrR family transcriptional regulator
MPRIRADSIVEHKQKTRREILDAGATLFRSQGYSDTNLGDVAAYVGIGRTTLYEYFSDKEDILVHIVEDRIPSVVDDILVDLPEEISVRDRLAELLVRGLQYVSSDVDLGSMLMREMAKLSPSAQRRIARAHAGLATEITRLCRVGMERGEFRAFDPEDVGRLVYSLMMTSSQTLMRGEVTEERIRRVSGTLVDLVFDGLAAARPERSHSR